MKKTLSIALLLLAPFSVSAQSMNEPLSDSELKSKQEAQQILSSPLGILLNQTGQLAILAGYYESCDKYDKKVLKDFESAFLKKGLQEVLAVKGTKEQFNMVYQQSKDKAIEESKGKTTKKDCDSVKKMLEDITKKIGK